MGQSYSSPRIAWALFLCGALLCGIFTASFWYQGSQYPLLVACFLGAVVAGSLALVGSAVRPTSMDLWVVILGALVVVSTLESRVLYLSTNATLWIAFFFAAYFIGRRFGQAAPDAGNLAGAIGAIGLLAGTFVIANHQVHDGAIGGPFLYRHMFAAVVTTCAFVCCFRFHTIESRWLRRGLLFVAAAVAFTLMGLGGSRGVMMSAVAALVVVHVTMPSGSRLRPVWFSAGAVAGLAAADLLAQGLVVDQAVTLADPQAAGLPRFVSWASVLPLIAEAPMTGHGPGLLFAVWPPHRFADDLSQGYYAHNSFLDIAVTMGIPAALVVACIIRSSVYAALRTRAVTPNAVWLLGGMVLLGVHALVDFPLLVPTLWLLLGLISGGLAFAGTPLGERVADPLTRLTPIVGMVVVLGLVLYALTSLVGSVSHQRAIDALERGDSESALVHANVAVRWWPSSDQGPSFRAHLVATAVLESETAAMNPAAAGALSLALADIERALNINPLRPSTYRTGARLTIAGHRLGLLDDGLDRAETLLREAIRVDPRDAGSRLMLAQILEAGGRRKAAIDVLLEGLKYPFADGDSREAYKNYARRLAAAAGHRQALERLNMP